MPKSVSHLLLSGLFFFVAIAIAIMNVQSQQQQVLRNEIGIEVDATVAFKRQTLESSGRSLRNVNVFTVYYFDEVPDAIRTPVVLKVGDQEIILSKGPPYTGDFHAYDIRGIPDDLFQATAQGQRVRVVYLPTNPEAVWLKQTLPQRTAVHWAFPAGMLVVGVCIVLATVRAWWISRTVSTSAS